jgi:hypothetical protein
LSFIDNPENKPEVNHKDKLNNSVENLEFAIYKEQQIHKFQIGLGNNFTRKIKQYKLDGILIKEYNSITKAAKEIGLHKSTI